MNVSNILEFQTKTRLIMGAGSRSLTGSELKSMGVTTVLIVTDKGIVGAGTTGRHHSLPRTGRNQTRPIRRCGS